MDLYPEVPELKLEPDDPGVDEEVQEIDEEVQEIEEEVQEIDEDEDQEGEVTEQDDELKQDEEGEDEIKYEQVEKMEGIGDDLIKQELLDHYETNKSSRVYCDECDYATTNPTSLIRHKASKHKIKKQGRYNCTIPLCKYTTSTFAHLKRHISSKIHKGENQEAINSLLSLEDLKQIDYNCPGCAFKTNDRSNLNRHILRKHPSKKPLGPQTNTTSKSAKGLKFPCAKCSYVANFANTLKRHMRNEHNPFRSAVARHIKLRCEICPFTSTNKTCLREHAALHQGSEGLLACKYCSFSTLDHKEVRAHMDDSHVTEKLPCPEVDCEKTFWNIRSLVSHRRKHSPGHVYECWQCNYKNTRASAVAFHFNSVHLKIKPHLCDKCPGAFPSRGRLLVHVRAVHCSDDKRFRHYCTVCGKDFSTKQYLTIHIRLHTGERPHTCEECGKSFSDSAYFSNHVKSHKRKAAGKFHVCDICDKKYTAASSLRSHKYVHNRISEEKPQKYSNEFKLMCINRVEEIGVSRSSSELGVNFSTLRGWVSMTKNPQRCEVCEKVFSYPAQLANHMRTHDASNVKKERAPKLRANIDDEFRRSVVAFAHEHGAQAAAEKYDVSESALRGWRAVTENPLTCPVREDQ